MVGECCWLKFWLLLLWDDVPAACRLSRHVWVSNALPLQLLWGPSCGPLVQMSAQLTANSGLLASGQAGQQAHSPPFSFFLRLHLQTARSLTKARLEFNLNFIDFGPSLTLLLESCCISRGEQAHTHTQKLTLPEPTSLAVAISFCQLVCACLLAFRV